ncbi:MAG: hypothetical protein J1F17_04660, partial [Oscillospiraceae bacterium]|nr:hypothetical protein [Oscillospiraceae bacterium]
MKKFISLFTVVSLVIVSICSTYVSVDATSTVDYVSKIDSGLIQVMDNATDTETIPVIVWFNEIDLEKVNQKIENELSKQIVNNKVSEETQELFDLKTNDPSISKNRVKIQDIEDNLTIADSQQLIKTERKFFKREYLNKNKSVCDKIEDKIGEIDITYISHYAPCIEVNLTKGQILSIVNISEVNNISYYNHDDIEFDFASEIDVVDSGKSQLANLTACGIQENIDKYNLTGSGINVGIIDTGFTYDSLNTYFSRVNISTDINCTPMTEKECKQNERGNSFSHGDYVSSIIGANGKNFKGAVKDCNMYLTNAADTY